MAPRNHDIQQQQHLLACKRKICRPLFSALEQIGAPYILRACSSSGRAPVLSKRELGSPSAIKEGEMEGQPCRMQGVCGSEQAGMKAANERDEGQIRLRKNERKSITEKCERSLSNDTAGRE
uniref:Uncharacterized protein n=1 Tax=Ananas comosus var. bracteatus TaxID=296719 RepID=A0A6V7PYX0_ANACO|nr:unnamed protein product [Ananas comosus var. bracteatus]